MPAVPPDWARRILEARGSGAPPRGQAAPAAPRERGLPSRSSNATAPRRDIQAALGRFLATRRGGNEPPPIPRHDTGGQRKDKNAQPYRFPADYMRGIGLGNTGLSLPPGNMRSTDDRYIQDRRGRSRLPSEAPTKDDFWSLEARTARSQTPQAQAVWDALARLQASEPRRLGAQAAGGAAAGGSRQTGPSFGGGRPPIPEMLGQRPQGGVDFSDGNWLDVLGRMIASAPNEDTGFLPFGQRRTQRGNALPY